MALRVNMLSGSTDPTTWLLSSRTNLRIKGDTDDFCSSEKEILMKNTLYTLLVLVAVLGSVVGAQAAPPFTYRTIALSGQDVDSHGEVKFGDFMTLLRIGAIDERGDVAFLAPLVGQGVGPTNNFEWKAHT